MKKPDRAADIRRTVTGITLILAPLAGLVGAVLGPNSAGGMEAELAFIAAEPGRWLVSNYLNLLSFMLFIPALLGLARSFRTTGVTMAYIGAGLALVGLYFHGVVIGYSLVEIPLVASGWGGALAFSEAMYESSAFTAILMPFLSFFVGLLVLSVALLRARVAPWWVPAAIVVGVVSNFVAPRIVSPELMLILFLLSFGPLGIGILRRRDEFGDEAGEPSVRASRDEGGRTTGAT